MTRTILSDPQRQRLDHTCEIASTLQLDDPHVALNFSGRLAREQYGWSPDFAQRVVGEYKRFLILAAIADHQITPSDEVDQAWHLHIVYTRSYHEWCDALFGQYMHHGPTKGGKSEGERFEQQYNDTLALYEAAFGETPPADIWPPARIRFSPRTLGARVRPVQYCLIPNRVLLRAALGLLILACLAIAALVLVQSGYTFFEDIHAQSTGEPSSEGHSRESTAPGPLFGIGIVLFVGLALAGVVALFIGTAPANVAAKDRKSSGCGFWFGCGGGGSGRGYDGGGDGGSGCGSGCGGGGCGGGCGS